MRLSTDSNTWYSEEQSTRHRPAKHGVNGVGQNDGEGHVPNTGSNDMLAYRRGYPNNRQAKTRIRPPNLGTSDQMAD